MSPRVLERDDFDSLIDVLRTRGYTVVGPTVESRAVVHRELESAADLPAGWTDEQDGGTYRLIETDDPSLFGHNAGPSSWKSELFPPVLRLWKARRTEDGFEVEEETPEPPNYAFVGVRSCDLHAIRIQDRVFTGGPHVEADYAARRDGAFIVAVNCAKAGGTCFCVSMGTGPRADEGYDLALTELTDGTHRFLVEVGSERGEDVLAALPVREAVAEDEEQADGVIARTAASMGREMEAGDIRELLLGNLEHERWAEVGDRCLTCGNCTMVCPTCFCHSVEDVTDLEGDTAERTREWDSCFTLEHSYIHGGSVRPGNRSRYRQWMTHKLATWIDQFGTSGCVGCGRCITWCPVAIDITEEAAAIRATDMREEDR